LHISTITNDEKEKIALLIDSGKNTYADLSKAFPRFSRETWIDIIGDGFKIEKPFSLNAYVSPHLMVNKTFIFFETCPDDYSAWYEFKPTDKFVLSVSADNLLHQMKKDHQQRLLTIASVVFSASAAIAAILTLLR
jgi:hypothetical protein